MIVRGLKRAVLINGNCDMDQSARAAFVNAQAACALAEIAAMQAANQSRVADGQGVMFQHGDFMAVQEKYLIGHNAVIQYLRDAT
jgi:hypothetical protein